MVSGTAMTARGSMAAPANRLLISSRRTVRVARADAASTAAASPRVQRKQTFPGASPWRASAPVAIASRALTTARGGQRVEGDDARVGVRRAHDVTRELDRHGEVGDEAPAPRQKARVLASADSRADAFASRHCANRAPRGAARDARTRHGR